MSRTRVCHILRLAMLTGCLAWACSGSGQSTATPANSSADSSLAEPVRELREQIRELQSAVAEIRAESQRYRAETAELRKELEAVRSGVKPEERPTAEPAQGTEVAGYPATGAQPSEANGEERKSERAASLEEQFELLSGKVDDQYQTKVESASKYRMRLSGIVLLNLFGNGGRVDNVDFPALSYSRSAHSSGGSIGASLRQSQIGFEVFGPQVFGARTKADLQIDLGGGFTPIPNGVNAGLLRLRTGTMRLDWDKTSIVAGQDGLFFSPTSPTSFASLVDSTPVVCRQSVGLDSAGESGASMDGGRGLEPGGAGGGARSGERRGARIQFLPPAASRRVIARSGTGHAGGMGAYHLWSTAADRRGRLLQPAGIWVWQKGGRMGGHVGLGSAAEPAVVTQWESIPRKGIGRHGRRNWPERNLERLRLDVGQHRSSRFEFCRGLDPAEVPAGTQVRVQRSVWLGQCVYGRLACIRVAERVRQSIAGQESRRLCECDLPAAFGRTVFGRIPAGEDVHDF